MEAWFDGYVLKNDAVLDIVNAVNRHVDCDGRVTGGTRLVYLNGERQDGDAKVGNGD